MSSDCCCAGGLKKSNDWFGPEFIIHRHLGSFYRDNPIMSRLITIPIAALTGALKVALFPLIAVVGLVVMPMIALVRFSQGKKEEGVEWLQAWGFCVLAVAGSVAFLGLFAFHIPLTWSIALIATAMTISIIIHVYKIAKEPGKLSKPLPQMA